MPATREAQQDLRISNQTLPEVCLVIVFVMPRSVNGDLLALEAVHVLMYPGFGSGIHLRILPTSSEGCWDTTCPYFHSPVGSGRALFAV